MESKHRMRSESDVVALRRAIEELHKACREEYEAIKAMIKKAVKPRGNTDGK